MARRVLREAVRDGTAGEMFVLPGTMRMSRCLGNTLLGLETNAGIMSPLCIYLDGSGTGGVVQICFGKNRLRHGSR